MPSFTASIYIEKAELTTNASGYWISVMPIRHSLPAIGATTQKRSRLGFAKQSAETTTRRKGQYRAKIIAKFIVLSAQISNPIPAAAQELRAGHHGEHAAFHSTYMQPETGTLLSDCIHPAEPDPADDRYSATQNSNRLLIWLGKTSEANVHRDVRIRTFISAATSLIQSSVQAA